MELRKKQEEIEDKILGPFAAKSANSKGREREEEKCDIRTDFQRDRDRIIHCKAFRRLKHKTQVFISPEGDHYRTRLTHTLEVSQIARTISRALGLNEDLTEAISLGHDLGHTPFGHAGESILDKLYPHGFEHSTQSLRVVDRIEKDGQGLNLTWEVRDGILNHRTSGKPGTMEGMVVQLSDKIAYINHDIDDAIRAGELNEKSIPRDIVEIIGDTSSQRINTMIRDTINESMDKDKIYMSSVMRETMGRLRTFMFERVYTGERALSEKKKVDVIMTSLYKNYKDYPETMDHEFKYLIEVGEEPERVVCDFIACMTDRYAVNRFRTLFIPSSWNIY